MVQFNVYGVCVILEDAEGENFDLFTVLDGFNRLDSLEYDSKEYSDVYHTIKAIIDKHHCDDEWDSLYWELNAYEDKRYYDYAIADFREYAKHKGEPDFDWNYYSDWHKDIYGFRPHY